jgi:hypothetical protein
MQNIKPVYVMAKPWSFSAYYKKTVQVSQSDLQFPAQNVKSYNFI